MKRSTERILTTHVGSLVRPPEILEVILSRAAGRETDRDAFERMVSDGVCQVVRKQAEVGIDIPSDGEYSKPNFFGYATERLDGLTTQSKAEAPTADELSDPGPGIPGLHGPVQRHVPHDVDAAISPARADRRGHRP